MSQGKTHENAEIYDPCCTDFCPQKKREEAGKAEGTNSIVFTVRYSTTQLPLAGSLGRVECLGGRKMLGSPAG
jgi:hypothetical protein